MYFSPRKFLTSMRAPPSLMAQLMGKCAYTARILYMNPMVTPLIMLLMWLQTVLTAANSFLFPKLFPSQQRAKTGWQGQHVFWMPSPLVVLWIRRSSTNAWIAGEAAQMRVYRRQPPA